jgi:hypothetical protein
MMRNGWLGHRSIASTTVYTALAPHLLGHAMWWPLNWAASAAGGLVPLRAKRSTAGLPPPGFPGRVTGIAGAFALGFQGNFLSRLLGFRGGILGDVLGGLTAAAGSVLNTNLNRKRMSWQKTLILASVSLVLSAIVTGLVAFIADHIL